MNNQKERIMDLMRKGIITESEAIELLEKAGLNQETGASDETTQQTDKEGYQTDSSEAVKQFVNQAGSVIKSLFQSAKKSVDNNVDFSNGFPSLKYGTKKETQTFDGVIKGISVTATSGDVTVVTKDIDKTIVETTYKVYGGVVEETLDEFIRDNVVLELDQGELVVNVKSKRIVIEMTIMLAASQIQDAKFDVVNGIVNIENLIAEDLNVKKVNGDLIVKDGTFKTVAVKAVNGEVRVVADFETADVSNVNGEIVVTATGINAENLKVKNVNGDVKISVPQNIGVVGYLKTTFGKYRTRIALDNPLEITKNGAALIRTATNSLTLDIATNTGSIWLKDGEVASQETTAPVQAEATETVEQAFEQTEQTNQTEQPETVEKAEPTVVPEVDNSKFETISEQKTDDESEVNQSHE
ncbi:DUF4097 family beta strand repeat-containing protein [Pseudolactococcus reticulitermitis]|nr:DUF4097 family beta strand repeat-containing protein [Lactococcus reticulitermitis]